MLLIYIFHLREPIDDDVFCSFRPVFIFLDCFPVLEVRTAHVSYHFFLSQDIFLFFQTIFHLLRQQVPCFYTYQGISVSRCPAALQGCQLHFSGMLLVHRPGSQSHSSQAGRNFLCQYFSRHLLLPSNFPLLTRRPF